MNGLELARDRGIDLNDQRLWLKISSERLSLVRYVFLVQVEDGIASANERAALEYADAVLIGWPDNDSEEVRDLADDEFDTVRKLMSIMQEHITVFKEQERHADIVEMTPMLVHITDCVAQIRRLYQPDFPLPTFSEIRRVVEEEWNEDMGKIDLSDSEPTVENIEEQTEHADEQREEHADQSSSDSTQDGSVKEQGGKSA